MTIRTDLLRAVTMGAFAPAVFAAALEAQSPASDGRWEPWLGCWAPALVAPGQSPTRVCVTAIRAGAAAEIASVRDGQVVGRDTIDTSGERRMVDARGCTGWQSGTWSRDARRVYLRSEMQCGGALKRTSSGLIAMSDRGEWLDIQGAAANGSSTVREMRYRVISTWTNELPVEFADVVRTRDLTPYASVARQIAGSQIAAKDVVEASKQLQADVVEAWLIERGQELDVDARTLVALADAGVPGNVTDVLIGLAYPERFTLRQAGPALVSGTTNAPAGSRYASRECLSAFDPMWYSYGYDTCMDRYNTLGYGYGSPYGYRYGYGYGYGYPFDAPIYTNGHFVPGTSPKNEPPHGVAVNGKGYTRPTTRANTQPDASDQGSARVGRNPTTASSGGGSSGKASGSSSSGSSSSGGSSSTGRTAQAKPPKPPPLP